MSDCLKIAIDFISPENLHRCVDLAVEYQAMAKDGAGTVWKEDILQLKMNLWYAWRMTRRWHQEFKAETSSQES